MRRKALPVAPRTLFLMLAMPWETWTPAGVLHALWVKREGASAGLAGAQFRTARIPYSVTALRT